MQEKIFAKCEINGWTEGIRTTNNRCKRKTINHRNPLTDVYTIVYTKKKKEMVLCRQLFKNGEIPRE